MEKFDWFVLPFTLGLLYLVVTLVITYTRWVKALPYSEFSKVKRGLFTRKTLLALKEVFLESLLHRKIFKVNPILGYMHASLALGWFLLILFGNWESRIYYDGHMSPPYVPIFFRFFNPNPGHFELDHFFHFSMDLLLLIVLSGVAIAWGKRFYSKLVGMRATTRLQAGDRFALGALWAIFPLRFVAESFSSGAYGGGHFLTANAGSFFASILPVANLAYPAWWAYSIALGTFFVALPFSRYMHIPTEVVLIFLRKYGVTEQNIATSYTKLELNSCSRCGVCIDTCQMSSAAGIRTMQSSYFIKNARNNTVCDEQSLNCLMCGRCDNICPVGIDIKSIRSQARAEKAINKEAAYKYIPPTPHRKADVVYFAGCMTHLQPSIKKAMIDILDQSGEKYWFMDEQGSICCGRPLQLAGKVLQARELMQSNIKLIAASGARTLVTSCPICYKIFKNEYLLDIEVMHHSQYIWQLIKTRKIEVKQQPYSVAYHDPCELGRGSGVYNEPRSVISSVSVMQSHKNEREEALCCGGSLANLKISGKSRTLIAQGAVDMLSINNPSAIATSCPLCKRTLAAQSPVKVIDIAEMVSKALIRRDKEPVKRKAKEPELLQTA